MRKRIKIWFHSGATSDIREFSIHKAVLGVIILIGFFVFAGASFIGYDYYRLKNISFNTSSHLELVQFIEKAIIETKANIIFTHHPSDLNNDHYHTSIACQAASKLSQRKRILFCKYFFLLQRLRW